MEEEGAPLQASWEPPGREDDDDDYDADHDEDEGDINIGGDDGKGWDGNGENQPAGSSAGTGQPSSLCQRAAIEPTAGPNLFEPRENPRSCAKMMRSQLFLFEPLLLAASENMQ